MKTINRIILLIVICLTTIANVEAQETMYIYKNGQVVGEHVLAEVDSMIFYQPTQGTITDSDGNEYQTVVIGTQTWMAENLKTTTYNDGIAIQNVTDGNVWNSLTTGAYCWYNNDEDTYKEPYGALYNWYAVNTDKLCPVGWHVPTNSEWETLVTFLGGSNVAGGKLKENSSDYWINPNEGATNESGFSALPVDHRYNGVTFGPLGYYAFFWSSSEESLNSSWRREVYYGDASIHNRITDKECGLSVRCIKD